MDIKHKFNKNNIGKLYLRLSLDSPPSSIEEKSAPDTLVNVLEIMQQLLLSTLNLPIHTKFMSW